MEEEAARGRSVAGEAQCHCTAGPRGLVDDERVRTIRFLSEWPSSDFVLF